MSSTNNRLLIVCPKGDFNAGGIVSNFQLIMYLKEKGYEIRVITAWEGTYNKVLQKAGISNRPIFYNWWTPRDTPELISTQSINAVVAIGKEIEDFEPDAVITNTSHIPWGAFAASLTNTPHIWIVREYPINNFEYLADKVEFIRRYSNKIMANSAELAKFYRKKYDYDVGSFMSYVDIENLKLGGRDPSKEVRLVSPNYISKTKNQIDLIRAAEILKSRRPDLRFSILLVGEKDRDYWPVFEKEINKSPLVASIEIHDRVDKPWEMVGKNDIIVQTSLSESIGRTTTEAMKLGVPVIASNIPGHTEAFGLGGGTLYELGDASDLANKIEHHLDHPGDIKEEAQKTKKRALKNMSSDASSGPFLQALKEIIGSENPVGVNALLWPYIRQYIENNREIIAKKNADTDMLMAAIDDLRNSRAYKLGRKQTDIIKKVLNVAKKGTGKK